MIEPSDDVIERAKVREVAGVFRSRRDLEATVEALQRAGFDRADIDALSNIHQVPVDGTIGNQPQISHLTGQPMIMPDDLASARAVVAGTLGTICAVAAVSWVVASGGGSGSAVLGGLLAGTAAAGIGYVATPWLSGNERTNLPEGLTAASGFILLVRVRSPEKTPQQILRDHGASSIRVREVEIEKRPDDIPLSSLRPDPWLGSDRLGQV